MLPFSKSDKVAAIFNDAGAINLATDWLELANCTVRPFMTGPAAKIWENRFPASMCKDLETALTSSNIIITGTGWGSETEHLSRVFARDKKLLNIAVIDHWTNFSTRFIYKGVEVLPDEVWVSDSFAKNEVEKTYPSVSTRLLPNLYLESKVKAIKKLCNERDNGNKQRILYALEPVKAQWGGKIDPEFQALDYFIENLKHLNLHEDVEIILRPHPSEPDNKYSDWLFGNQQLNIEIQKDRPIEQQIANADYVVGCETFALIIAAEAGKNVICSIPPWGHSCRLRSNRIKMLSDLVAAAI